MIRGAHHKRYFKREDDLPFPVVLIVGICGTIGAIGLVIVVLLGVAAAVREAGHLMGWW